MRSAAPTRKRAAKAQVKKPSPPAKDRKQDSEDIERAVYDGMQDLRAKTPNPAND